MVAVSRIGVGADSATSVAGEEPTGVSAGDGIVASLVGARSLSCGGVGLPSPVGGTLLLADAIFASLVGAVLPLFVGAILPSLVGATRASRVGAIVLLVGAG